MRRPHISLRTRLTLIYGSLFLVMGIALETITYVLAAQAVRSRFHITITGGPPLGGPDTRLSGDNDIANQIARQQHALLTQLVQGSMLTLVALTLLSVALGYVVSGRLLRPLRHMTATARRLSESTLHEERIGLTGSPDEIKELADSFDNLLDRLYRAFDSQRQFIANASHELRTPLAINRTIIDVAVAKPGAPDAVKALGAKLLGAISRQERLIEGLLLLARSQHEQHEQHQRSPVDLAALTISAIHQLRALAHEARVSVIHRLSRAQVVGDPVLLERCAANLIENAIKYNGPDGSIWVSTGESGERAWLHVENTGPPVPPDHIATIFQPFERLSADRTNSARGAGLGLSIVRAVVEAQHGTIEATARPGGGLSVTLLLPRAAPATVDGQAPPQHALPADA